MARMHPKDGIAMTDQLTERLRSGIICTNCDHLNDEHDDLHEAAHLIELLSEQEDQKTQSIWVHLGTHMLQLTGDDDFYFLIRQLQTESEHDDGSANALIFVRKIIDDLHAAKKQNQKLSQQIEQLRNIPQPEIPLDRIRRASEQERADVAWLIVALDYITQIQQHIKDNS